LGIQSRAVSAREGIGDGESSVTARSVPLPVWISAGYIILFGAFADFNSQMSTWLLECVACVLYFPIGVWFWPLISHSTGQDLNAGQWMILFGSMFVNAVFMGWLLAALARRVHTRITRNRKRHAERDA
jgi:hypothetical protein